MKAVIIPNTECAYEKEKYQATPHTSTPNAWLSFVSFWKEIKMKTEVKQDEQEVERKRKEAGPSIMRKSPWNFPNWPRGDEFLRLLESWVAFNQRSLFFQEAGAPEALRSLSRCWEPHTLYFILLIKGMLQEGRIYFAQMFHLKTIDEPKHSGVLFGA